VRCLRRPQQLDHFFGQPVQRCYANAPARLAQRRTPTTISLSIASITGRSMCFTSSTPRRTGKRNMQKRIQVNSCQSKGQTAALQPLA
jgi:hypothetical protein